MSIHSIGGSTIINGLIAIMKLAVIVLIILKKPQRREATMMKKVEIISLAVDPDLKEAIQEEAEKQDRSVSSLIRLIIKKALEGAEGIKK